MTTQSRNWLKFSTLTAATFLMGVFFARMFNLPVMGLAQDRNGSNAVETPIATVEAPRLANTGSLAELSAAFAAVTDAVRPSVVFIMADGFETPSAVNVQLPPGMQLPPGYQFPRGLGRNQTPVAPIPSRSIGSGFVVSKDGYIVTNHHVIEGATRIRVRLLDDRVFEATVVGSDKSTDIGILKINATGLTPAALGSSEKVRVGEWVLAIGNPLGNDLTFSVTQGIVSAKGRGIPINGNDTTTRSDIHDFIQTDAAINQGNSGGPLLNVKGEVIGIISAIASTTGTYQGYAFAIPMDLASQVMNQLIAHGKFERSLLQISVVNADEDDAAYLGLPTISGVRVSGFSDASSPAKVAGILPGDVIVAIDGKPIKYTAQLQQIVGFHRPGDALKIEVARKGGHREFMVKTVGAGASAPEAKPVAAPETVSINKVVAKNRLGVVVEPLNATTGAPFGVTQGLLIKDIATGSPADEKLQSGADGYMPDVITEVEGKAVKTEDDLRSALADAKNGVVTLTVMVGKTATLVRVRLIPQ